MVWVKACRSPVQASCLSVLKELMTQLLVCPSPQTGVLVPGWSVSTLSHCTLRTSKPREFTIKQLASQKPDPFLSRTTPMSSAHLSFFPATWFSSLKPPHDLLFELPNTEAPNPLLLLHHQISAWFQVLLRASCPPPGCPRSLPLPLWALDLLKLSLWGKMSSLPPLLVFRRCKKTG